MELYDWQEVDVNHWFSSGGVGLNASETGSGKTRVAVGCIEISQSRTVLIIGPKSTFKSWEHTVKTVLDQELIHINTKAAGKRAYTSIAFGVEGIYFIGTELFRRYDWSNVHVDLAIVDEVHKLSTRNTVGLKALNTLQPKYKLALSATPFRNKLENAWGVLKWLYPGMEYWQPDDGYFARRPGVDRNVMTKFVTKSVKRDFRLKSGKVVTRRVDELFPLRSCNPAYFWQFAELFFKLKKNFFREGALEVEREQIQGEVTSLLPHYVRHLKREKCCEYHPEGFATWPEPEERRIYLPMTSKQKKYYRQIDEEQIAWLDKRPVNVQLSITERLRKAEAALGEMTVDPDSQVPYFADDCASAKIDWVVEQMDDGYLAGEQFVCFTHSRKFAHVAAKRLGAFEWSGNASDAARDEAREAFIRGDLRVIVAVISASGTGTDFMQKAHNAVWFSETTDNTDNSQARGRLDRGGQTKGVIDWVLLSEETEEAGWMSKRMEKLLQMRGALDKK